MSPQLQTASADVLKISVLYGSPLEFMIADRVIEISAISEAIAIRHKQRINEENILRRNIK